MVSDIHLSFLYANNEQLEIEIESDSIISVRSELDYQVFNRIVR